MTTEIVKNPQIIKAESTALSTGLQQCDIEFVFTRLKTQTWRENRLILQRRATVFAYNPDKTAAYAGFKLTPDNAKKVADLYYRIYRQQGVFVKIKGIAVENIDELYKWAHCWILSHAATDKHKYCTIRNWDPQTYTGIADWREYINRPMGQIETRLNLPCKCVWFKPDLSKPGTLREQYLDDARTQGCNKCPLFNMNRFAMRMLEDGEQTARDAYKFWQDPINNAIKDFVDDVLKKDKIEDKSE